MTEPRKGNMRATDQVTVLCRLGELLQVFTFRRCGVHVIADGYRRMLELHGSDMHDIAPQQQLLVLALDQVHGVAGRVSISGLRAYPRHQIGIAFENDELAGADVWRERHRGSLKEPL